VSESFPHRTVTLKATPERNLPHSVPLSHPPLRLRVSQLVPNRTRRGVPEPVQRHPGSLHVQRQKLQILLQLINNGPSTGVNAEMVKRELEIRDVRLHLRVEKLFHDKCEKEKKLLAYRQNKGTQSGYVSLESPTGNSHEILRQRHAGFSGIVLFLVHAPKGLVIRPFVSPHHVQELVFGSPPVGAFVGEENGGPTDAEEAIGYQHGLVVPEVPILSDVLGADDDGVSVAVNLEHVFGEIDGDDAGAAAHAAKVEAFDIATELVPVDDHGGEGGGGVEEAAIDDEDSDVLGLDAGVGEEVVEGAEHDLLGLFPGGGHGGAGGDGVHGLGEVGFLAEAGAEENLALEIDGGGEEVAGEGGVVDELLEVDGEVVGGTVAGEVEEVDGCGSGHDVEGGSQGEDGGYSDDAEEVVLEVGPELLNLLRLHLRSLYEDYGHEREQTQSHQV